jgi:hypothetical protein
VHAFAYVYMCVYAFTRCVYVYMCVCSAAGVVRTISMQRHLILSAVGFVSNQLVVCLQSLIFHFNFHSHLCGATLGVMNRALLTG